MSDIKLALTYLRTRLLVTALTIFSVALGLGLATIVMVLSRQATDTLRNETAYWDMVIGAKGSPLQLVLNGLYYLDAPTGNISVSLWDKLKGDPAIANLVPISMGDNYFGAPIVGTTTDFFAVRFPGKPPLQQGRLFAKPFEAVVGAEVARQHRLGLDRQIVGAHGWGKSDDLHPQFPYTVVGLLAPTGTSVDRAVYTDYHSTWIVHSHPDAEEKVDPRHDPTKEITTLLVRLHLPGRRFQMVREINQHETAMAVIPVDEINRVLMTFLGPLQREQLAIAYLVVLVSALSILVSLYLTIYQRRRDIAILRSLGATQSNIFSLITLEAACLAGFGVLLGWLGGHGGMALLSPLCLDRFGIGINAWQIQPAELVIAASVWVLGILAGLVPAATAYRLPVAETMARE